MYKIGINGPAESGKSTLSKQLGSYLENGYIKHVEYISLAKPLKDFCIDYLGLSSWQVYTKEGKNSPTNYTALHITNEEFSTLFGANCPRDKYIVLTARHILQIWGERLRAWTEDFFVTKFQHSCYKLRGSYTDIVICEDWRYKNEACLFDFKCIIQEPNVMQHKSEVDLKDYVGNIDLYLKPRDSQNSVQLIIAELLKREIIDEL